MTPAAVGFTVAIAGVFGLVIGSFLNVVVYRVPAGIPLTRESRCPGCGSPVRPWQNVPVLSWLALRGRCASCEAPISPRYPLVEVATGLAFALLAWMMTDAVATGSSATAGIDSQWAVVPVAVAYFYVAAVSIALTLIDLDTHRLPNAIVLPSYVVLVILFVLACVLGAEWAALLRAALGGAALYGFYLILRLIRPGGMGGGDVKLAGVLGMALGWVGWGALIVGAFAAFLLGGVFGLALLAFRRAGRKSAIPFGPWMILGAWIGIFVGDAVAGWYVGLFLAG